MATEDGGKAPEGATGKLPTDQLMQELRELVKVSGQRAVSSLGKSAGGAGQKLVRLAQDKGKNLVSNIGGAAAKKAVKSGTEALTDKAEDAVGGGGGIAKTAMKAGAGAVADKAKDAVGAGGGGGGGGGGGKVTNIVEEIDVGVPVSVVYNQWTQFTDFPDFMKKVEKVEQESDTELSWRAQVLWSHRDWKSTIVDQVPDERIVWKSEGSKGYVDGAVTFHELSPNLTKILLVLKYYPQGFFEKTGNLWRAQGRRARLELKHFRRHVMTEVILNPDDLQGWRGEIHDSEVVEQEQGEETDQEQGEDKDQRSQQAEQEEGQEEQEQEQQAEQEEGQEQEQEQQAEQEEQQPKKRNRQPASR